MQFDKSLMCKKTMVIFNKRGKKLVCEVDNNPYRKPL